MDIENKLEELKTQFSYDDFLEVLKKIDERPNISRKAQQILFDIMQMTNDNYIVDGKKGTLGHMLLEQKLIKKEKVTPSLLLYFFEEQLEKINVLKLPVFFTYDTGMSHQVAPQDKSQSFVVNLNSFDRFTDIDEYNYTILSCALHEIVHAYQYTCQEVANTENEKLTAQNYKNMISFVNRYMGGDNQSNIAIHESFIPEIEAENNANLYMLYIGQKHPEYFNSELLNKKLQSFLNRKNTPTLDSYDSFQDLLEYMKNLLSQRGILTEEEINYLQSLKEKNKKCKEVSNLIKESNYNIFLKQYFTIEQDKIILEDNKKTRLP